MGPSCRYLPNKLLISHDDKKLGLLNQNCNMLLPRTKSRFCRKKPGWREEEGSQTGFGFLDGKAVS